MWNTGGYAGGMWNTLLDSEVVEYRRICSRYVEYTYLIPRPYTKVISISSTWANQLKK